MRTEREDLAFEAGWCAGYAARRGMKLEERDARATADWHAYRRETAQPSRCGCCGAMTTAGTMCVACRVSD